MLWSLSRARRVLLALAACLLQGAMPALIPWNPAFAQEPAKHALVLYSNVRTMPAVALIDEVISRTLPERAGVHVDISNEFIDFDRIAGQDYPIQLLRFLESKYAGTTIDVVIAVREPALRFALDHRDRLFPGVPIVYAAISAQELGSRELPSGVIGAPIRYEPAKTLELAVRLQPETRRVVVVTGSGRYDRAWEAFLRKSFAPFESHLAVDYWAGLPFAEVLARLGRLEPGTVVYTPGVMQDGSGRRFVPRQTGVDMAAASPVPIYSTISPAIGTGIVGGLLVPLEAASGAAAELAARVLNGEPLPSIGNDTPVRNAYMFDDRALRRFGIDESSLPENSTILYREPSLWQSHRWEIIGVLAIIAAQAALIAALLLQRRIRVRAESRLRESEQRMQLAASATGLGMWSHDLVRHEFWASGEHRALLGIGDDEHYDFARFLGAVHDDDREPVRRAIDAAVDGGDEYDVQYRVPIAGGGIRWVQSRGRVERDARGNPARLRDVTADITARKDAELAAQRSRDEMAYLSRVGMLGQLSGSLAHELNQPLTAILSNAQAALRFLRSDAADLDEVRAILTDIVADDKRAGDVIRRLRALFERGEVKREPLDVNELVVGVLKLLRSDLVSRGVGVVTEFGPDLPAAIGDRVQLQQLLLNLMLNACEAMDQVDGDVRRISLRTCRRDDDEVVVAIADTGPGIPPDQLERIFQPFVTSKPMGVGLGLVIARSIAAAHGGALSAANNADGGATFAFTLPVHLPQPASSVDAAAEAVALAER